MNDIAREKLHEIIIQYGRSVCDNPTRLEGLLRDFCGQQRREISVIIGALREQIPADLLRSQNSVPPDILLARLTNRLQDNLGLAEDAAHWAVDSWALALGIISHPRGENVHSNSQSIPQQPTNSQVNSGGYSPPPTVLEPHRRENIYQPNTPVLTPFIVNPPPQANAAQYGTKKVEYAGFFTRFVGLFFDWFYAGILNVSTIYLVGLIVNFDIMADDSEMSVVIVSVIGTIVYWLWYALWESSAKQATPGKMIVGIMITDLNSNRISFARATGRFFGKIISAFSLGIGFLIAVFTEKKQALHDIMAGTLVVKKGNMDWIKSLLEAPIKTILVVAGLAFIITAVVGKLSSWVELNYRWQRWLVGILGVIFLIIGINQDIKSDSDSAKKGTQPPNTTPPITSTSPPITSTSPPLTTQPTTSPLTNNNLSGKWKVSHQGKSGFSISQ